MDQTTAKPDFSGPVVLVMGLTGAGKTTFINHITKSGRPVGHTLDGCTRKSEASFPEIEGVAVALVDTPGFDDSEHSDAQIVVDVTTWIAANLGGTRPITAVVYLHSIEHKRLYGSAWNNFRMFQKLVGSSCMKNVGLVTTHWDVVPYEQATDREAQLIDKSWATMFAAGARTYRLHNDPTSSLEVVTDLLKAQPAFIKIQREMAPEYQGKPLSRTDVGEDVCEGLKKRIAAALDDIHKMEEQLKDDSLSSDLRQSIKQQLGLARERLKRYKDDLNMVEKTPTWTESAVACGKKHGFTALNLAYQIYNRGQHGAAINLAQQEGYHIGAKAALEAVAAGVDSVAAGVESMQMLNTVLGITTLGLGTFVFGPLVAVGGAAAWIGTKMIS